MKTLLLGSLWFLVCSTTVILNFHVCDHSYEQLQKCKISECDLSRYLVGAVFGADFTAGFGATVSAGASKLLDAGVEPP
jgi:hypothetical protein